MPSFERLANSMSVVRERCAAPRFAIACFAIASATIAAIGYEDMRRARDVQGALATPTAVSAKQAASAQDPRDVRKHLPSLALFGSARDPTAPIAASVPPAPATETLPASSTPLRLYGVIAAEPPAAARAFVGSDEASQMVLRPGERLPDGAALIEVSARGVVLERAGHREWLALPVDTSHTGEAPAVRPRFMARPVARLAGSRSPSS
ncbi:MAG TPA: type II secretion system protein N [Gammaproteobacteria bacterium]|nr:type II secretion system protein N [Gammaproteobacteria bacterium]